MQKGPWHSGMPLNKKFGRGLLVVQLELSSVLSFLAFYAVALLCTRVVYHYEAYLRGEEGESELGE